LRLRRLGSRLYYDFTAQALDDATSWERLADSVAVEVRRHSPAAIPIAVASATPPQTTQGGGVVAAPKPTALPVVTEPRGQVQVAPASTGGAMPSVSVSNIVNNSTNFNNSNSNNSNINSNNSKNILATGTETSTAISTAWAHLTLRCAIK